MTTRRDALTVVVRCSAEIHNNEPGPEILRVQKFMS